MGQSGQCHAPAALFLGMGPGTHGRGDSVGPRTIQPIASHYTNYSILADEQIQYSAVHIVLNILY
jgi:hypothetical protein